MKKELTIKIGFDTESDSVGDINRVILGAITLSNNNAMYVIDASIDNEIVFNSKGFGEKLRKREWAEGVENENR